MTQRLILGIDPGQTGAIAALADGVSAGFIDIPTRERIKGGGRIVDSRKLAASLRGLLHEHPGAHLVACIERVQSIGKSPGAHMLRFGQSDGFVRCAVEIILAVDLFEVEPQTWKRHFGLLKTEKDDARVLAMQRFPRAALRLLQKKNGGRADALLIAAWAEATEAWVPASTPLRRTPKRPKLRPTVVEDDYTLAG